MELLRKLIGFPQLSKPRAKSAISTIPERAVTIQDLIDDDRSVYPWRWMWGTTKAAVPACAIVWLPIPVLSYFLPFIGHVGITDSKCNVFEISGLPFCPAYVAKNLLPFGEPIYITRLDPNLVKKQFGALSQRQAWDYCLLLAKSGMQSHKILVDNCHDYVCNSLNLMRYPAPFGCRKWTSLNMGLFLCFKGEYRPGGRAKTWLPFFGAIWSVFAAGVGFLVMLVS